MILLFAGVVLLFVYALEPERESKVLLILLRDIGIALIPAGTILLANEVFTRYQFEQMISDRMHTVIEQSGFLGEKFGTIEGQMSEILSSIPFAIRLRSLGVGELYTTRPDTKRLVDMLRAADAGSDIYMLGIALTTLMDGRVQEAVKQKLALDCKMRLLWLDPNSPHVAQRAIEESRPYVELKGDLLTTDTHHVNFITNRLSNYQENIEYGRYSSLPSYFIFMTNITMIVGFYLPGARGIFFPHLELSRREGGIYDAFREHFNSLWTVTKTPDAAADRDTGQ
jgi:hypothetical protein